MPIQKFGNTIKECTARGLGSNTKIYRLIQQGKLRAVKNGCSTIITNMEEYIASLEPAVINVPSMVGIGVKPRTRVRIEDTE
jgi:hypothetical protein